MDCCPLRCRPIAAAPGVSTLSFLRVASACDVVALHVLHVLACGSRTLRERTRFCPSSARLRRRCKKRSNGQPGLSKKQTTSTLWAERALLQVRWLPVCVSSPPVCRVAVAQGDDSLVHRCAGLFQPAVFRDPLRYVSRYCCAALTQSIESVIHEFDPW